MPCSTTHSLAYVTRVHSSAVCSTSCRSLVHSWQPGMLAQAAHTHSLLVPHAAPCASAQLLRAFATATEASAAQASKKPDLDAYPRDSTKYPCAPGTIKMKPKKGWRAVPSVPKFLGLSGLIPFFAFSPPILHATATSMSSVAALQPLAHAILTDIYPYSGMLQIGYGTAIVSFLGAVHWGSAMQSRTGTTTKLMFERYIWSVTPALVVFPAAAWGVKTGSVIVLSALLATFAIDAKFNWKGAALANVQLTTAACLFDTLSVRVSVLACIYIYRAACSCDLCVTIFVSF